MPPIRSISDYDKLGKCNKNPLAFELVPLRWVLVTFHSIDYAFSLSLFAGTDDGWPAPRLHDVDISESRARQLYWDLALDVRKIYHVCQLVHGDLSEYNLLYHQGKAFVIDVSQSVEHDHPNALEFLRKDINNLNEFFKRKGQAIIVNKCPQCVYSFHRCPV